MITIDRKQIAIRDLFCSALGQEVMDYLEEEYLFSSYSPDSPADRALYKLGRCSVIADIKTIIRRVNNGVYTEGDE